MTEFIETLPDGACSNTLILAHGSGQSADSPFMTEFAESVTGDGSATRVLRFNFPYMLKIQEEGKMRPPDRAPVLEQSYREAVQQVRNSSPAGQPIFIGGKSLGGRIATMIATGLEVDGVVCLGYPFHPPGKPDRLRTDHFTDLSCPVLVCQGQRDSFGNASEVDGYNLPANFEICWIKDGDHSFKPRKSSGVSQNDNIDRAARATRKFLSNHGN